MRGNFIPESVIFTFTTFSDILLVSMVALYIIKKLNIFKKLPDNVFRTIILSINTAFIIVTILMEILKLYDPFTEKNDVMFRFLGISMTLAVGIYVYYNELR